MESLNNLELNSYFNRKTQIELIFRIFFKNVNIKLKIFILINKHILYIALNS